MGTAEVSRLTRAQKSVVVAAVLGWVLDQFDFWLMVFVLRDIARDFHVEIPAVAFGLVLSLAMRPIGAFLFGRAADLYGRRPALMASILAYSVLAFASGFAVNLAMLLVLRALFGIAMGGEWGVGSSLAMETIPPGARGFVSGIMQTGGPVGYLLASIVYGLLFSTIGWRGMFMIGALPALLVLYIRGRTEESPQWRPAETRSEMGDLLAYGRLVLYAVVLWSGMAFWQSQPMLAIGGILTTLTMAIFLARRDVGLWIEFFAILAMLGVDVCAHAGLVSELMAIIYNAAAILTGVFLKSHWRVGVYAVLLMTALNFFTHGTGDLYPTFLQVQHGLSPRLVGAVAVIFNIGGIAGSLVFGTLSERIGRRRAIAAAALLSLPFVPFFAFGTSPMVLAGAGLLMNFAVMGTWGVVPCYLNELSPAHVRGTFPGFVYQLGNLLASVNATLQADYASRHGNNYATALAVVAVASALAIVILVGFFGIERKGVALGITAAITPATLGSEA